MTKLKIALLLLVVGLWMWPSYGPQTVQAISHPISRGDSVTVDSGVVLVVRPGGGLTAQSGAVLSGISGGSGGGLDSADTIRVDRLHVRRPGDDDYGRITFGEAEDHTIWMLNGFWRIRSNNRPYTILSVEGDPTEEVGDSTYGKEATFSLNRGKEGSGGRELVSLVNQDYGTRAMGHQARLSLVRSANAPGESLRATNLTFVVRWTDHTINTLGGADSVYHGLELHPRVIGTHPNDSLYRVDANFPGRVAIGAVFADTTDSLQRGWADEALDVHGNAVVRGTISAAGERTVNAPDTSLSFTRRRTAVLTDNSYSLRDLPRSRHLGLVYPLYRPFKFDADSSGTGYGPNRTNPDWWFRKFIDAVKSHPEIDHIVILNPAMDLTYSDSGPGTVRSSEFEDAIRWIHGAGGSVLMYVSAGYTIYNPGGVVPYAKTVTQMKTQVDSAYYLYPEIDGIFLDEIPYYTTSSDSAARATTAVDSVCAYISELGGYSMVNPGGWQENVAYNVAGISNSTVVCEASGFEQGWLLEAMVGGYADADSLGMIRVPVQQKVVMAHTTLNSTPWDSLANASLSYRKLADLHTYFVDANVQRWGWSLPWNTGEFAKWVHRGALFLDARYDFLVQDSLRVGASDNVVATTTFPQLSVNANSASPHAGLFINRADFSSTSQIRFLTAGTEYWRFGQLAADSTMGLQYYSGGWQSAMAISKTGLISVSEPTASAHIATKNYVDTQIAAAGGGSDSLMSRLINSWNGSYSGTQTWTGFIDCDTLTTTSEVLCVVARMGSENTLVDTLVQAVVMHDSVRVAGSAAITAAKGQVVSGISSRFTLGTSTLVMPIASAGTCSLGLGEGNKFMVRDASATDDCYIAVWKLR